MSVNYDTYVTNTGLSPGIYGIAPPTYEEALIAQYIPSQGTVNTVSWQISHLVNQEAIHNDRSNI